MLFCFLPAGQLPLNLKSLSFYSRSSSLKQTHLDFPHFVCVCVCDCTVKYCYLSRSQGNYIDCNLKTVGLVFLIWLLSSPSYLCFSFCQPLLTMTKPSKLAVARLDVGEEAFKEISTILLLIIPLVWLLVCLWFLPYL